MSQPSHGISQALTPSLPGSAALLRLARRLWRVLPGFARRNLGVLIPRGLRSPHPAEPLPPVLPRRDLPPSLRILAPAEPLIEGRRLPDPGAAPLASIVVPVFNQAHHTLGCLDALARAGATLPFEVIVVDDCSDAETEATLAARDDIVLLRNTENLGFIGSCNRGAEAARGRWLVFLNNDTAVQPGWLDRLVEAASQPGVGLVGAKLVYPDGRLQEAGGIVFRDASGWNWGRGGDPAEPRYNRVRDADYVSGAAILIERALFAELGGFDRRYAPAYYEDTDLAFQVRALGLRVLYQPLAQVVHYEGVTSGTELTGDGVKANQLRNQPVFAGKWWAALEPMGSDADLPAIADRRTDLAALILDPPVAGFEPGVLAERRAQLAERLTALGYLVTVADGCAHAGAQTERLQALGAQPLYSPYAPDPLAVVETMGPGLALLVLGPGVAKAEAERARGFCPGVPVLDASRLDPGPLDAPMLDRALARIDAAPFAGHCPACGRDAAFVGPAESLVCNRCGAGPEARTLALASAHALGAADLQAVLRLEPRAGLEGSLPGLPGGWSGERSALDLLAVADPDGRGAADPYAPARWFGRLSAGGTLLLVTPYDPASPGRRDGVAGRELPRALAAAGFAARCETFPVPRAGIVRRHLFVARRPPA